MITYQSTVGGSHKLQCLHALHLAQAEWHAEWIHAVRGMRCTPGMWPKSSHTASLMKPSMTTAAWSDTCMPCQAATPWDNTVTQPSPSPQQLQAWSIQHITARAQSTLWQRIQLQHVSTFLEQHSKAPAPCSSESVHQAGIIPAPLARDPSAWAHPVTGSYAKKHVQDAVQLASEQLSKLTRAAWRQVMESVSMPRDRQGAVIPHRLSDAVLLGASELYGTAHHGFIQQLPAPARAQMAHKPAQLCSSVNCFPSKPTPSADSAAQHTHMATRAMFVVFAATGPFDTVQQTVRLPTSLQPWLFSGVLTPAQQLAQPLISKLVLPPPVKRSSYRTVEMLDAAEWCAAHELMSGLARHITVPSSLVQLAQRVEHVGSIAESSIILPRPVHVLPRMRVGAAIGTASASALFQAPATRRSKFDEMCTRVAMQAMIPVCAARCSVLLELSTAAQPAASTSPSLASTSPTPPDQAGGNRSPPMIPLGQSVLESSKTLSCGASQASLSTPGRGSPCAPSAGSLPASRMIIQADLVAQYQLVQRIEAEYDLVCVEREHAEADMLPNPHEGVLLIFADQPGDARSDLLRLLRAWRHIWCVHIIITGSAATLRPAQLRAALPRVQRLQVANARQPPERRGAVLVLPRVEDVVAQLQSVLSGSIGHPAAWLMTEQSQLESQLESCQFPMHNVWTRAAFGAAQSGQHADPTLVECWRHVARADMPTMLLELNRRSSD